VTIIRPTLGTFFFTVNMQFLRSLTKNYAGRRSWMCVAKILAGKHCAGAVTENVVKINYRDTNSGYGECWGRLQLLKRLCTGDAVSVQFHPVLPIFQLLSHRG
jgi:hypothetical protein